LFTPDVIAHETSRTITGTRTTGSEPLFKEAEYYYRGFVRDVRMVRICRKNVRRKNCEEGVLRIPRKEKVCWKDKKQMVR
jgi:HSP20 family molecular chaperone IbpA